MFEFGQGDIGQVILGCLLTQAGVVTLFMLVFVVRERCMESSDPVRWWQLKRARKECWAVIRETIWKHLVK